MLDRLATLRIAVVGDFFLDKYLDIDGRRTEKSIETGLDAYQVTRVRSSPGAGGTVTSNLAALGVGRIFALTVIGVDGEGFELKRELSRRGIDLSYVIESPDRITPAYTKPMLGDAGPMVRELNRLDIKNRSPMPSMLVREISWRLDALMDQADAVVIADQVSEPECGVITLAIRERLAELAARVPEMPVLADSRKQIGMFRNVIAKPNLAECLRAAGLALEDSPKLDHVCRAAKQLSARTARPVYCTLGQQGILYVDQAHSVHVRAYEVEGETDIVGAGDSSTAGIVCALCAGAQPAEAAALGNLVASITITQIGTTGCATPEQVVARWRELGGVS